MIAVDAAVELAHIQARKAEFLIGIEVEGREGDRDLRMLVGRAQLRVGIRRPAADAGLEQEYE